MDFILHNLDFCYAYIDNILIASKIHTEREEHLRILLKKLQEFGLGINSGRSNFGADEIKFQCYIVNSQGVRPDPEPVEAILKYPRPSTVKHLRQFFDSVNFYRRFIPHSAKIQQVLNAQLCGSKRNNVPIEWSNELERVFNELKNALANAAMLAHPIMGAPLLISADASDYATGAVLQQYV